MTLVVTHTEGFLGCFTVNPDGSMRQRALIDTGSQAPTPQELAETGVVLAENYGWQINGVIPAPVKQALPAQKKKAIPLKRGPEPGYHHRKYPSTEQKREMILAYLGEHGPTILTDVLRGIGQPTDQTAISNWYHTFSALFKEGLIIKAVPSKGGKPAVYSLP